MCPFCLATMGLMVAGTVSSGGLAALVLKGFGKNNGAGETQLNSSDERKNQNVTSALTTTSESNKRRELIRPRYTHVPHCAWREGLASWHGAERRKKGVEGKFESLSHREVLAGGRTL